MTPGEGIIITPRMARRMDRRMTSATSATPATPTTPAIPAIPASLHNQLELSNPKLPDEPLAELQRYLIEIVTYTLAADFGLVSRALGQSGPSTGSQQATSILADEEKKELLRLASIVQGLHQRYLHNQWSLTRKRDREDVFHSIVVPGERRMRINLDYILDLIFTYAEHQCDPEKREHTLISLYTLPRGLARFFCALFKSDPSKSTDCLADTLGSFTWVINVICPNESARIVLGQALADLQVKMGMKHLKLLNEYSYTFCRPVRRGFWGVYETLKSDVRFNGDGIYSD